MIYNEVDIQALANRIDESEKEDIKSILYHIEHNEELQEALETEDYTTLYTFFINLYDNESAGANGVTQTLLLMGIHLNNILKNVPILYNSMLRNLELKNVYIPGNIKIINDYSFRSNSIDYLLLGEGVEKINTHAFTNSTINKAIVFPNSLIAIEPWAFSNSAIPEVVYADTPWIVAYMDEEFPGWGVNVEPLANFPLNKFPAVI